MLSKKVFLAGEPNFSAPPVHAARADVRDHVESQEGDHRASYASDRGLQKRRQSKPVFREISGAAQFSTFSTASTRSGHPLRNQVPARISASAKASVPGRRITACAVPFLDWIFTSATCRSRRRSPDLPTL